MTKLTLNVVQAIDDLRNKVNSDPILQSLLYDLNLMPEQIGNDSRKWGYVESIVNHFEDALKQYEGKVAVPVDELVILKKIAIASGVSAKDLEGDFSVIESMINAMLNARPYGS